MDRKSSAANSGTGSSSINNTQSDLSDLEKYKARWAKIYDDTVRQINEVREQEKKSRISKQSKSSSSS
ncbi:hypothetical protein BO70DRAFT_361430 [Aspergillus heteromorphus CBS 117.55]|uniref:Uncharacterized protein n=1 Tax=Aspergillus heteromorphus CBS 117.55 TaxID=1448321 RepID=A0A317WIG4_9EURO|nr:uncharacterized protein BO70DRAFT_361430 [Aspergillus heteromorphus CBS 117.55]PWY85072.1 hypothetical protein BO70DRAFT_361430 [Aspergillus heteromorphus CBS 117.55]